jgi:hypothetical protein
VRPPKGARPQAPPSPRLNLYLTPRLVARLNGFAHDMGIRPTDLARIAISSHLDEIAARRAMVRTEELDGAAKRVWHAAANVLDGTPGRRRRGAP